MENQTTVKDVLTDVVRTLNEINVPMSKLNEIGLPIARAIQGINICLDAFNRQEQEAHEPEIEIVEVGDSIPDGEANA